MSAPAEPPGGPRLLRPLVQAVYWTLYLLLLAFLFAVLTTQVRPAGGGVSPSLAARIGQRPR